MEIDSDEEARHLRIFAAGKAFSDEMLEIRARCYADRPEEYIRYLEAFYETAMMNWTSTLDECVVLRAEMRRMMSVYDAACMFADIETSINARPGHAAWSSLMAAVDAARKAAR